MDDDEARAIARTCAIVAELAESELAESELAESAPGSSLDPGTPDRGTLRSSVAAELRDARERLDDMAAASWARGHHAAETVAAYLSAIVRRWIDVDAGGVSGFSSRRSSRRSIHASRPTYPAPGGGYPGALATVDGGWSGTGSSPKSSDRPGSAGSPRSPRATWTGPWGADSVPGSPAHPGHYPVEAGDRGLAAEDFEIVKPISRGAHGKVHLCRKRATGDVYAMKVMRKKDLIYKNMVSQAMAERDALINTDNPFIVKLYYSFSSTRHVYIVTEFAVGGDLSSLLQQFGRLEESHCRQYAAEITLALEYCHERGIIHRDVKPDNLLIAANGHLKLTDFGLSKIGVARTGVGTSANAAVPRDIPTSARMRTARVSDGSVDVRAGNATDLYPFDGGIGSRETLERGRSNPAQSHPERSPHGRGGTRLRSTAARQGSPVAIASVRAIVRIRLRPGDDDSATNATGRAAMRATEPQPELVVRVASLGRRARRRRYRIGVGVRVAEGRVPERGSTRSATASRYAEVRDRLPRDSRHERIHADFRTGQAGVCRPGIRRVRRRESGGGNRQPHSVGGSRRPSSLAFGASSRFTREIRRVEGIFRLGNEHGDASAPSIGVGVGGDVALLRREHGVKVHVAEKRVRLDLGGAPRGAQSEFRLGAEEPRDEFLRHGGESRVVVVRVRVERPIRTGIRRPRDVPSEDVFENFHRGLGVERRNPDQQLEHHRAERPPVHLGTVRLAHQHLGREVIRRALRHPRPGVFTRA